MTFTTILMILLVAAYLNSQCHCAPHEPRISRAERRAREADYIRSMWRIHAKANPHIDDPSKRPILISIVIMAAALTVPAVLQLFQLFR
jgi:hypothetical protein